MYVAFPNHRSVVSSSISLLALSMLLVSPPGAVAGTITVDLGVEESRMNHRANGYLVSIDPTQPSMDLILPLKPTSFRGERRLGLCKL